MSKVNPDATSEQESPVTDNESKVTIAVNKEKYQPSRTAAGTKSLNNGDPVAQALEGMTLEEVQDLADKFIGENDFRTRYAKLNRGMQRMNIGNRIRGHMRKADVLDKDKNVVKTGEEVFAKVSAPLVKATKARIAAEEKAKATKAAASEKNSESKAA